MLDGGVDAEADCATSRNGLGRVGALARDELVAANLLVSHVLDWAVAVVIGGLSDISTCLSQT